MPSYNPPPSGLTPTPVPAGPMAYLKSPIGLSTALTWLFGAMIVADLFSLWAGLRLRSAMTELRADPASDALFDRTNAAEALYGVSGLVQGGVMIALIVVFLVWFWRVRGNAEVFGPEFQSMARGWTIGSWFVPIANLWLPRRVASDIWGASEPAGPPTSQALLNGWWLMFAATMVFGRYASSDYTRAESFEEIRDAVTLLSVSDAVDVVACVVAVLFVRRLTGMQTAKALAGPSA
ncbi:DUF4328 domain-containing protein [Streptomyces sp. NPDC050418]|uniref:DUF4328 domain-containing protein n=1 Tax=Streptomyces sp. NPDC050418 TaxID=3365612 RepID=UPI0037ABF9CB